MNVIFESLAQQDYEQELLTLLNQSVGLADQFEQETRDFVERIKQFPEL
jgi:predicted KAP-like P-loop ATPase